MRILHYALGFPPYRSGGLTKFCMDLMKQQVKDGNDVALLWPGRIGIIDKKVRVNEGRIYVADNLKIRNFEVINPIPVSFDEGIKKFDVFTNEGDKDPYIRLIKDFAPDVIHIHTFMGLHKSFLYAAKDFGIRLVFTAHDFFPICPKVTMFRHGEICKSVEECKDCGICNNTALDIRKIQALQSPLYRKLKDSYVIKKLRRNHRNNYLSESTDTSTNQSVGSSNDFKRLRNYYKSMLDLMDIVHYNSSVTKEVYERYMGARLNVIIPITHGNIADNRRIKNFNHDKIRMRYLGPYGGGKGFFYLKAALDKLWNERQDFSLDVHFALSEVSPYIIQNGRYSYSELEKIFDNTDVLITPSIWYETFGFTVLEALSFGVPVIITDTVGAKDIVADGVGIIVNNSKSDELIEMLRCINMDKLVEMNERIVDNQKILLLSEMKNLIEVQCYCG